MQGFERKQFFQTKQIPRGRMSKRETFIRLPEEELEHGLETLCEHKNGGTYFTWAQRRMPFCVKKHGFYLEKHRDKIKFLPKPEVWQNRRELSKNAS